ncbi:ATP-binding protein [Burkholderia cenocepacia]|uniref:ATP-binding protein n=1 Tax=Burkholderia cenocepacia TaxID=95486 RepID=UPI0016259346|nr:AAA family ATPase [Burkholderia cenocepacia]
MEKSAASDMEYDFGAPEWRSEYRSADNKAPDQSFESLAPWLEYADHILQHALATQQQRGEDRFHMQGVLIPPDQLARTLAQPTGRPHWSDVLIEDVPWAADNPPPVAKGRLALLATRYSLSEFELFAIVLCLLPMLEIRYAPMFAYLQGDEQACWPSVDFVVNLFAASPEQRVACRRALSEHGEVLLGEGLIYTAERNGRASTRSDAYYLRLDDAVFFYLTSSEPNVLPARLAEAAHWCAPSAAGAVIAQGSWAAYGQRITRFCFGDASSELDQAVPLMFLQGGLGRQALLTQLALESGRQVLWLNLDAFAEEFDDAWPVMATALRVARLHGAMLVFDSLSDVLTQKRHVRLFEALERRLATYSGPIVCMLGSDETGSILTRHPRLTITLPLRTRDDDIPLLQAALAEATSDFQWDPERLLTRTRLNPDVLDQTVWEARWYGALRGNHGQVTEADLTQALRVRGQQHFGPLAQRVQPKRTFDDLIVDARLQEQLYEILAAIRQRDKVLARGFDRKIAYGTGISALFYGESGTGKSMAAEVLAGAMGVDLIRVDLSTVVNKYIGETEKNLSKIFDLAIADTGVLMFDEADALFGKRSEVKDAHDRHANIEVSYLLQRLEHYPGLVVLSTNNRGHLDDAFTRRLTFIARFAPPDIALRERMWHAIWPAHIEISDDIDFSKLATVTELTGASIRNVALLASWLAAEQSREVRQVDLEQAIRRELGKTGRLVPQF